MRKIALLLATSPCFFYCPGVANAQAVGDTGGQVQADQVAPEAGGLTQEIIVTARRKSENLQNVPETVNVVSGDTVKKLGLTQFQDVASIIPGLSLATSPGSGTPAPTLRGVTFDANASPSPTIDVYVNEAPSNVFDVFGAIYDLGDVQVLRGPQGTLRGQTAPSGAILLNTHRADVNNVGGYVSTLGTQKGSINEQGAVNIPVVSGLLGVRVAGLIDQNDGNFVKSANGGRSPEVDTYSGRASIAFTPSSNLRADLSVQYLRRRSYQYLQVAGTGSLGGVSPLAPAGYNGPVITPGERLAADHTPNYENTKSTMVTANVTWDVLGHQVQYIGGYAKGDKLTVGSLNNGNALPGQVIPSPLATDSSNWTHEIRVSSTGSGHLLDYSFGYFHSKGQGTTNGTSAGAALAGAFGNPSAPSPYVYDTYYVLNSDVRSASKTSEDSVYGNATLHIGRKTEVTGGLRYIIQTHANQQLGVYLGSGNIAITNPIAPYPCSFAGLGATYPGYCDVPIAASGTPIIAASSDKTNHPVIYNASITHRFTDNFTMYGTVGSSWRRGGFNISITDTSGDPALRSLLFPPNETSTSYEIGAKGTLFDRRLRYSLAGYYQHFNNLAFQVTSIPYVSSNGQTQTVASSFMNIGANAVIKGLDFDSSFQVSRNFSIGLAASYADGHVDNALIPCRDSNFDGVPDSGSPTLANFQAAGERIAFCKSTQSVSRVPNWTATLQSEYDLPLSTHSDAYIRGFATYNPKNHNADIGYVVPDYVMMNLYAGVRAGDGRWDVGVFVRNVTNAGVELTRDPSLLIPSIDTDTPFGSSGYRSVSYTPPREFGINVRYTFGK